MRYRPGIKTHPVRQGIAHASRAGAVDSYLVALYWTCFLTQGACPMNLRFMLSLITVPTLVGPWLTLGLMAERASAVGISHTTPLLSSQAACALPPERRLDSASPWQRHSGTMVASAGTRTDDTSNLNFSEAESDAAAVLFGCDCSACIQALRQLRTQSFMNNGKGHCWTSMQRRVSPQTMQDVLQDLEKREAGQER